MDSLDYHGFDNTGILKLHESIVDTIVINYLIVISSMNSGF